MRSRVQDEETRDQDLRILTLLFGIDCKPVRPKKIVKRLNLTSVWVVYGAIRRWKYRRGWLDEIVPRAAQNEPKRTNTI